MREHDAAVGALAKVGVVGPGDARHDDVAAFDEAQMRRLRDSPDVVVDVAHPWPGGVDQRPSPHLARGAAALDQNTPNAVFRVEREISRVRVSIAAPRCAAARALSTTSRASSTRQSQ